MSLDPGGSPTLRAILEALLFACDEPLNLDEVTGLLGDDRKEEIQLALHDLTRSYETDRRGIRVQQLAGGYRLTTDPDTAPFIREMVRGRNRKRLSRAGFETLAIIAYKQPITAPEIQEIRGKNPSAILATLLERHLIKILGRKKVVGKPFLYGTTQEFLVRFGLNSLGDLPSMEEFDTLLQMRLGEGVSGGEAATAQLPMSLTADTDEGNSFDSTTSGSSRSEDEERRDLMEAAGEET